MDYIEIVFKNSPEQNELLIALLSQWHYDSFEETEDGVNAYIKAEKFSNEKLLNVVEPLKEAGNISRTKSLIKDQNWNALWESNFEPVLIGDEIHVHAPFHHRRQGVIYEIVIEPKMSFGTGHHATTLLMMEEMIRMNLLDESVLDIGCGSGILAILAAKMGAKNVLAIDVDDWAFKNAFENCRTNQSQQIIVQKGDVSLIRGKAFDVILSNIKRNVLLSDFKEYVLSLRTDGNLLMSGFMANDLSTMKETGIRLKLNVINHATKENWAMIHFRKIP